MLDDIEELFQKGVEQQKLGKIEVASQLYTAILKAQPEHPDANHNMGVLAVGVDKIQEALPFFEVALEANADTALFWVSYIDALIKVERMVDAQAVFDQAKNNGAKGDGFDQLEKRLNAPNEVPIEPLFGDQGIATKQPNILDTLKLDQALRLAKKTAKEGSLENAKRIYQHILVKFSKNKKAIDGIKALTSGSIGKASKIQDPSQDQLRLLINLYSQGQLQQVLEQATVLLRQFPSSSVLYNIVGAVYKGIGKWDASIEAYKKALAIKPDYGDAYNNMGLTLQDQGKLEEAIAAYSKALTIKPDHVEAYNNFGNILLEQGKLDEAIEAYSKALTIKPDSAEAHNNSGNALQQQGKLEDAVEAYNKALVIKPDFAEAYYNIGNALKGVVFKKPSSNLQKVITTILDHKTYVRPAEISSAAICLLKFEPVLQKVLWRQSKGQLIQFLHETVLSLTELPLLLKLMGLCPLADLKLEKGLTVIRSALLLSNAELKPSPDILRFQSALALQCFTNEYIYNQSEHEDEALAALEVVVKQALSNGEQPSSQTILCLASYKPLNEYEWSSALLVSNEIQEVFTRQVTEPKQEASLKSDLPVLEDINDKISSKVREQYEVSPYPRWVNLGLALEPAPIPSVMNAMKLKLFDDKINEVGSPSILIAGCGTGQHSIETATRFKDSKVLAIDLSLSSLAYAKRKTEELAIQNIEYMQADILDLGKLDRQFDIVESAGVLHHMDDPMAGWRVLTDCLRPSGLMKIGLYSELARKDIVEMRREISKAGIGSDNEEMKSFRTMVMKSDKVHHKKILGFNDFYSLSELKDLLFHVQEHRLTIPQIQDCLAELGLKFCGFETDKIVSHFKLIYTDAEDPYDLDKWQTYEEANPSAFAGMYQFWCQKIA